MKVMIDPGLPQHRKIQRLAREMGVGSATALGWWVGCLCRVMRETPQGLLGDWRETDVSRACLYTGSPQRLVRALLKVGLLEKRAKGYAIHDWLEHQGDILAEREQARERKRRQREREADVTRDKRDCHASPIPPLPSPSYPIPTPPPGEGLTEKLPPPAGDTITETLAIAARSAGIAGNALTVKQYLSRWAKAAGGAAKLEAMLMRGDFRGKTVIEIEDFFGGNKRGDGQLQADQPKLRK